jgi:uncharacterized membrane protein
METINLNEMENEVRNSKKKRIIITTIITSIACLIPLIIGLVIWKKLPEQLAVHFNFHDVPDRYASKSFVVFGMPIIYLLMNLCINISILFADKKSAGKKQSKQINLITSWIVPVICDSVSIIIYLFALGSNIDIFKCISCIVSVVFIILGNYIPKAKQNLVVGFRTKTTLENPEIWNKVNRFGGWCLVICGLINLAGVFTPFGKYVFIICIILIAFLPLIYQFILKHKYNSK